MSNLHPAGEYKARRYQSGSSNAEPVSIAVRDDEFHLTDSAGAKLVVPMHDVSLKLGGSASDRVVLEMPDTGDTVIVNDLDFLKVVKKSQATSVITRQVKRAESARTMNKLQGFVFAGVVAGCVMMFAGCLFVAIILEPAKEAEDKAKSTQEVAKSTSEDSPPAPAEDLTKLENAYQKQVKKILLNAWPTPPKGQHSTVLVEIKLAKDGTVMTANVKESSNNKQLDASAIAAVKKCSPLPAPPSHWEEPIILDFTFNPLDKHSLKTNAASPHHKKGHAK